jgi:uncharacterized MAPEG superfamily protein
MTRDQKIVATGAASGVVAMAVLVWVLSRVISAPALSDASERFAYALPWAAVAAIPLFMMLGAVGNARFLGEAIDPTLGKEDQKTLVNGRVADNTLQQFTIFVVALLALTVTLPSDGLSFVPATAITFVIARIVFWIGYRIHPLYRAPGFSSTAYLNLGMIVAVLWLWLR